MRDKLIELLEEAKIQALSTIGSLNNGFGEWYADHLRTNGVIVLPCKVGDTVWKIEDVWYLDDKETWTHHYEKEVVEFMVRSVSISCNSKGVWTKKFRICQVKNGKTIDHQRNIDFADFGKTVFLTREEAEAKLKEGGKG